jgi:hypothetical protein
LSFFAAHAGAAKVYAIEASSMAQHANVFKALTLSKQFQQNNNQMFSNLDFDQEQ